MIHKPVHKQATGLGCGRLVYDACCTRRWSDEPLQFCPACSDYTNLLYYMSHSEISDTFRPFSPARTSGGSAQQPHVWSLRTIWIMILHPEHYAKLGRPAINLFCGQFLGANLPTSRPCGHLLEVQVCREKTRKKDTPKLKKCPWAAL